MNLSHHGFDSNQDSRVWDAVNEHPVITSPLSITASPSTRKQKVTYTRAMNVRTFQIINLGLLVVLAGLLIAIAAGQAIPRFAVASMIGLQSVVRAFRELKFGTEASRRRLPFNLLISLVFIYLIMNTSQR
jgi:hypothetical protein